MLPLGHRTGASDMVFVQCLDEFFIAARERHPPQVLGQRERSILESLRVCGGKVRQSFAASVIKVGSSIVDGAPFWFLLDRYSHFG